ncbi:MAG: ABC transporter permease [Nitriliruptorales bacterium]|nr:ABC transporter permease [Nitriliruptorales bacterium]
MEGWLIPFRGAMRFQLRALRRTPTYLMVLVTIPSYTVIFLALTDQADRPDLFGAAVLAPVLIAMWGVAIWVAGMIVRGDRFLGVLEAAIATPTPYSVVLLARILVVTLAGWVAMAETWLTAWIGFGVVIEIPHPVTFVLTVALTTLAMAATAVIMASAFVLSRVANTFATSASYPFYVLGGVLVPVALLPAWVQPLSRLVFLSWSSDLLRDSLALAPVTNVAGRLAAIAVLTVAGFAVAAWTLGRVLHHVRETGELAFR